jgi:drug/metabolite transporter (DMT)-like permease
MNWFFLALSAGFVSASNVWLSKRFVTQNLNPILLGGMVHLLGAFVCLLVLPFAPIKFTLNLNLLLALLGMGLVYTLGNSLYFLALNKTELSEIDLLLRTSSFWTFFLGIFLLKEAYGIQMLGAAALILASVLLLSKQRFPIRFSQAHLLALGAAFSFGWGNVIDKSLSQHFDALSYTTIHLFLTGFGMLLVARPQTRALQTPALWGVTSWSIAASFALTQILIILAFAAGGSAGQVILVAQVRLFILMSVGIILLKERDHIPFKLLSALCMIAGLMLLSS